MLTTSVWAAIAIALVLGAALGGWLGLRYTRRRFNKRLRRVTEELRQRHNAAADQLRAAQTRAQAELEQTRNSFKRQAVAIAAEPRAALQRTEDRLKAAYAELDRLRGGGDVFVVPSQPVDGFALTQPMETTQKMQKMENAIS